MILRFKRATPNPNQYCVDGTTPVCSTSSGNTSNNLCDMSSSIYEWTQDRYHSSYQGAPDDGSGWCDDSCPVNSIDNQYNPTDHSERVLRSSSWGFFSNSYNYRAVFRSRDESYTKAAAIGGRLARDIP